MKQKLSIPEQIKYMEKINNINFDNYSKEKAQLFLFNNNYFFKLKSYAKLFEKINTTENNEDKKKYKDLHFESLIELSKLDYYLRRIFFNMTLAIEHSLKIELLNNITRDPTEDGYTFIRNFFNKYPQKERSLTNMLSQDNYSSEIIKKNITNIAVWNYVEVIDFGTFELLYEFYYENKKIYEKSILIDYLWSVRKVRNACAHNNCLLVSLNKAAKIKNEREDTKNFKNNRFLSFLSKKISLTKGEKNLLNSFLLKDLLIVVIVFEEVVKSNEVKKHQIEDLLNLLNSRFIKNKSMFNIKKPDDKKLIESYRVFKKIIDFYNKKK